MPGESDHSAAARIPFWVHQVVELLLGILLLVQGARTGQHTAVLLTLGVLLLLLALCSDGALAAWPWIGRRVHRVLDLVVVAVLALSPLVLGVDEVFAVVILEVAAAAMLYLALRTEWRRAPKRTKRKSSAVSPGASAPPAPPASRPAARQAPATPMARKLGTAVGRARDDGPRQLGRLVGRAQRAARAARAPEPPPPAPSDPAERPPDPPEPGPPV
jgi:hypothetical protein